ncbi:hypothetical protein RRG08_010180 [Elysia crispata]|uniref:Uncharacterized protein n=1 Tax=Elysia crispata TaxID=231223 RepID=A0AAE1AKL6_9GAST|nr:hypothetical protein RRG08_010180 [Elysia crispata]
MGFVGSERNAGPREVLSTHSGSRLPDLSGGVNGRVHYLTRLGHNVWKGKHHSDCLGLASWSRPLCNGGQGTLYACSVQCAVGHAFYKQTLCNRCNADAHSIKLQISF